MFQEPVVHTSREERKERELTIVAEIITTTTDRQERLRLWTERTGKSEPALYRRIAELNGE